MCSLSSETHTCSYRLAVTTSLGVREKGFLGKCQLSNRCTLLNCTHCQDPHHSHSNLIHRLIVFQMVIRQVSGITVSKYNLPPPGPDFVIVTLYCNDSTDNQKVFSGVFSLCFPCPSAFHLVEAGKHQDC